MSHHWQFNITCAKYNFEGLYTEIHQSLYLMAMTFLMSFKKKTDLEIFRFLAFFLLIIWKLTDMHHWALSKNSVFYADSKWKKSSRKVAQLLTVHSRHLWIVEFLCLMSPVFSHIQDNPALLQRDQTNLIYLRVFLFVFLKNKY